ncbi:hypothetical protein AB0M47_07610 [Hamadaea sp. NPDC051192]|uniref:hypothetical protein n=1 Tax=Hamadaea sp. NPDC051192 TaxID=3154940 RepID=UPI00342CF3E6
MLIVIALTLAGCSAPTTPVPGKASPLSPPEPVSVQRGDIVSVVALEGAVQATPEYVLWSARKAAVAAGKGVRPGRRVKAGDVIARQGSTVLKAPVAGYFVRWLVPLGVEVAARVPVAELRYQGFGVAASFPPELSYRVYGGPTSAQVQIANGPGPFGCALLPSVQSPATDGPRVAVLCAIPTDVAAFAGLKATIGVRTGERHGVLVLPASAVSSTADRGIVWKTTGGAYAETQVRVGITDGISIEIVSGLAEGDQVLPYPPTLSVTVR